MGFHNEPFNYGQVALNAVTATQVAGLNHSRESVIVVNMSTIEVYIGDASVTSSNGLYLPGNKGASVTIPTTQAVYAISASVTPSVAFMEVIA